MEFRRAENILNSSAQPNLEYHKISLADDVSRAASMKQQKTLELKEESERQARLQEEKKRFTEVFTEMEKISQKFTETKDALVKKIPQQLCDLSFTMAELIVEDLLGGEASVYLKYIQNQIEKLNFPKINAIFLSAKDFEIVQSVLDEAVHSHLKGLLKVDESIEPNTFYISTDESDFINDFRSRLASLKKEFKIHLDGEEVSNA